MDAQINSMVFDSCLDQVWSLFAQFVSYVQHGSNLRPSAIVSLPLYCGQNLCLLTQFEIYCIYWLSNQTTIQFIHLLHDNSQNSFCN